jgi:hypothetical protein
VLELGSLRASFDPADPFDSKTAERRKTHRFARADDRDRMARMPAYEIAQLNVGRAVAPLDSPVMAGFMNWLDDINALAERHPGFLWRLQGDNGNNTSLKLTGDPLFIVNLSVWASIDALYDFTYRSAHKTVFKRRFAAPDTAGEEPAA